MNYRMILTAAFVICQMSCGSDNLAEPSTENTPEEEARAALNNDDWDKAIELYSALITEQPADFRLYPLLGTCYAGRSGVDLLNIVKAQFSAGSSANGGIFGTIGSFLPQSPTDSQVSDIAAAVNIITSMPEDHRSNSGEYIYSAEAFFQLNLYTAAQGGMFINKFSQITETGELDQEKLQEMSEEEVDALLTNLGSVASGGDDLATGVSEALEGINGQEGGSSKEKLINYLNATNSN